MLEGSLKAVWKLNIVNAMMGNSSMKYIGSLDFF